MASGTSRKGAVRRIAATIAFLLPSVLSQSKLGVHARTYWQINEQSLPLGGRFLLTLVAQETIHVGVASIWYKSF